MCPHTSESLYPEILVQGFWCVWTHYGILASENLLKDIHFCKELKKYLFQKTAKKRNPDDASGIWNFKRTSWWFSRTKWDFLRVFSFLFNSNLKYGQGLALNLNFCTNSAILMTKSHRTQIWVFLQHLHDIFDPKTTMKNRELCLSTDPLWCLKMVEHVHNLSARNKMLCWNQKKCVHTDQNLWYRKN